MKEITQEQFGERLAQLRKAKKLTQAQAAEVLGITNETLSRIERAAQWTEFAMLAKLATLYGVDLADLFAIPAPGKGNAQRAVVQEIVDALRGLSVSQAIIARDVVKALVTALKASKNPKHKAEPT